MSVRFPNLGIEVNNLKTGITVFGIPIAYYGIIIAVSMLVGLSLVEWQAKRTGQKPELYLDFALYAIIISIIGARLYFVLFSFDDFKDNLFHILNVRTGGLAIYGAIIGGVATAFVFSKVRKISFLKLSDTCIVGLLAGQVIGRWGNFFNREAFGGYTDGLFAMQIRKSDVSLRYVSEELNRHLVMLDGVEYIQVHPTFLYESFLNLLLLIFIVLYTKHKKFDGELSFLYLFVYGVGRSLIESLRTDQLLIWGTKIPVSLFTSVILATFALVVLSIKYMKWYKKN